eukprot:Amastigsp_a176199_11.p2 type:complete len:219 gc:universal Amastigsp_a176199_11:1-657(+)
MGEESEGGGTESDDSEAIRMRKAAFKVEAKKLKAQKAELKRSQATAQAVERASKLGVKPLTAEAVTALRRGTKGTKCPSVTMWKLSQPALVQCGACAAAKISRQAFHVDAELDGSAFVPGSFVCNGCFSRQMEKITKAAAASGATAPKLENKANAAKSTAAAAMEVDGARSAAAEPSEGARESHKKDKKEKEKSKDVSEKKDKKEKKEKKMKAKRTDD